MLDSNIAQFADMGSHLSTNNALFKAAKLISPTAGFYVGKIK